MKFRGSLQCSQKPENCPYPNPDECSLCAPILFP